MVHVWDATTGVLSFIYRGHAAGVTAIAWSPDGHFMASASLDRTVQIWNVDTGQKISSYQGHAGMIYAVAWSPDGKCIASTNGGGTDTTVHIWDVATGEKVLTYHGHAYWTRAVAWSPDGKRIVSASKDNSVQVWSAEHVPIIHSNRPQLQGGVLTFRAHTDSVFAVVWLPDGNHIASASGDGSVQVWQAG
jgi:WD40 repeat protein